MSPVRYRITGCACLVGVVRTNSPISPSGSGSPVSGSTISGRKWSSKMTSAPLCSDHSDATPGPMISERP